MHIFLHISRRLGAPSLLGLTLLLSACASGGGEASKSLGAAQSANGGMANAGGNAVTTTGQSVSDAGSRIANSPTLIPGTADAQKDFGGTVSNGGLTLQALGGALNAGMKDPQNPVGSGAAASGKVIGNAGRTLQSAGQTISDLGAASSPLQPLNPLTSQVGAGVSNAGKLVEAGGMLATLSASSGPGAQAARTLSTAVAPITNAMNQAAAANPPSNLAGGNASATGNSLAAGLSGANPLASINSAISASAGGLLNLPALLPSAPKQ